MQEPFVKVSEVEYQVLLSGKYVSIATPFEKVSQIFNLYISLGGVIDPTTGEVQTDIITLVGSFKAVANLLLTQHDEEGKVVKEGNCASLATSDVITLFKLANELITVFTKALETSLAPTPNQNAVEEKTQK
jgi:hypothetical protein